MRTLRLIEGKWLSRVSWAGSNRLSLEYKQFWLQPHTPLCYHTFSGKNTYYFYSNTFYSEIKQDPTDNRFPLEGRVCGQAGGRTVLVLLISYLSGILAFFSLQINYFMGKGEAIWGCGKEERARCQKLCQNASNSTPIGSMIVDKSLPPSEPWIFFFIYNIEKQNANLTELCGGWNAITAGDALCGL